MSRPRATTYDERFCFLESVWAIPGYGLLCTDPNISQGLIDGTVTKAPRYEVDHHIGNGFWGPQSSNKTIKGLNFQASVCWYYRQMLLLANNQPVDLGMKAGRALRVHFADEGRLVKARNRVLKQR